jgi:hypothetical protein
MFSRRLIQLALASLLLALAPLQGEEENLWPFYVRRPAGGGESAQAIGPLFFRQNSPAAAWHGLRPLYMDVTAGGVNEGSFLYPFFTWRQQEDYRTFSFFQLVNLRTDETGEGPADRRFDVWPFWFSRNNGDPDDSYRALFPLAGTIKHRFGKDRISFVAFPLYGHTEKNGREITHAPWPFLRFIGGDGYHGFEFWPLFGRSTHDGDYDRRFWLWPLFYRSASKLSDPVPEVKIGALPFYSRDTAPGYINENYLWPFFGYSDRTAPYRYHETRYFWPFLVQGEGDARIVNRWAPFYSHSEIKGTEKTWFLWPLYRNQRWQSEGLAQDKTQFLFFLYWSLQQRSPDNPALASAHKTHLWPLYSAWDNGAGSRQVQALSPFEIFFPNNATVRRLWTPLFALYRYERQPDTTVRHSWLWDAVTWRRGPAEREFHLALLGGYSSNATKQRVSLGGGLLGWQRPTGGRWRFFLFDFPSKAAMQAPSP